jgi:hypothetical protein
LNSDTDPDTVVEWKILWKIADQTLERDKNLVFLLENFFFSVIQVPEHIWKQLEAPFWNNWGSKYSSKDPNLTKKICGFESNTNEFGSITLQILYT